MATQILTAQSASKQVTHLTPQIIDFGIVKDSAGVALDIDTGFTAACQVTLDNGRSSFPKVTLSGTWAYGTDGSLTLTKTLAQANDLPAGNWQYVVTLSDDAFTTWAIHMSGSMRVIGNQ